MIVICCCIVFGRGQNSCNLLRQTTKHAFENFVGDSPVAHTLVAGLLTWMLFVAGQTFVKDGHKQSTLSVYSVAFSLKL